ncbi:autotransporter outer membrane beta-barrel domain-containing protein [Pseudomonas sp. ZS1P83]
MIAQHQCRPHHLALAIALALGCTDFSFAQEISTQADALVVETADPPVDALEAFMNNPDTRKAPITKAAEGIDRTFGDENDLVIVSGRGSIAGFIDGGAGTNFLQLDTASGGKLDDSRRFNGLEIKRSTWTSNGPGNFDTGVWVRPKATLINDGLINGEAFTQGTLVNTGTIGAGVTVQSGGTLNNSGIVLGNVSIDEKGVFTGNGTVGALQVRGKLAVDKMHGAPTVKGDLTLSNTAELTYEVDPDRNSGTITVGGTASLGGATLKIVTTASDYATLSDQRILVAKRVEGEFGKIVSNLAFLTPKFDHQKEHVDLIFTRNATPFESAANSSSGKELGKSIIDPNDLPQAQAPADDTFTHTETLHSAVDTDPSATSITIAEIPPTVTPPSTVAGTPVSTHTTMANAARTVPKLRIPINAAVAALLTADKQTASRAIEQLAASDHANLAKATLNSDSPISATMLSAMGQLDSAGGDKRPGNAPRLATGSEASGRVWLQALGHGGTLDRDNDALKHSTQGLVLGADWGGDQAWRIGVLGGKSETRLDSRGLDANLDSWHLGAYALRQNGPLSLRLGATYSNHDGNTKRRVAFNGFSDRPEGRFDANTQQAFAQLAYNLGRADVSIEPFASLGYQRYQRDGYTEKGGAATLKVHGQTRRNVNSTLGLRLAMLNTLDNGMQLTPRFSAGWKHTYGEVESDTRQRLVTGGRDFTVSGAALDRDSLQVDAGLDFGLSATHSVGVVLSGEVGSDSRNHGVMGQWRMAF